MVIDVHTQKNCFLLSRSTGIFQLVFFFKTQSVLNVMNFKKRITFDDKLLIKMIGSVLDRSKKKKQFFFKQTQFCSYTIRNLTYTHPVQNDYDTTVNY